MGDDYEGPVTVAADDGSERVLKDKDVWQQSETIMEMVKDTDPGDTIPLAAVPKEALDKVVEYMEKMAAFKAENASDEMKQTWTNDYKKSMEAQDQLPLLFQTMTAANFMNVKTLLDELCKFVAEMIAQRTPNEILDYFNIKKDATYEEEQALIATHKWIDPDGLIMKDYEKRAEELKKENPDKYDGKSTGEIINLSRADAAEERMSRGGPAGTGASGGD
jgi:S-phase kinase-associated protein 1